MPSRLGQGFLECLDPHKSASNLPKKSVPGLYSDCQQKKNGDHLKKKTSSWNLNPFCASEFWNNSKSQTVAVWSLHGAGKHLVAQLFFQQHARTLVLFAVQRSSRVFNEFVLAWHVFFFAEKLRVARRGCFEKFHAAVCSDLQPRNFLCRQEVVQDGAVA